MAFSLLPAGAGPQGAGIYRDGPRQMQAARPASKAFGISPSYEALRSALPAAQAGRGLLGVERQDFVADAQVHDAAVPGPEVEAQIHLVLIEQAEARRDADLFVAHGLVAFGHDVVAVDRDRAVACAQEPAG